MKKNVIILGILYIALGVFEGLYVLGSGLPNAVGIEIIIGYQMLGLCIFGIIVGIGLLKFRPWARLRALVLAVIYLVMGIIYFPLNRFLLLYTHVILPSTILGVYTLWLLLSRDVAGLFTGQSGKVGEIMRCWRTKDGDILIEGPVQPMDSVYCPLVCASGETVKGTAIFYLLNSEGTINWIYQGNEGSLQEHFYCSGYIVEDNELREYYSDYNTDTDAPPQCHISVELSGLQAVDPATEPVAGKLDSALATYKQERQRIAEQEHREWEERLESFYSALPEFENEALLEFVWQYEGPAIIIRRKDGPLVWRDITYPYSGKYLFRELEKILKDRYGERLKSFETDIHDDDYLRFNPD